MVSYDDIEVAFQFVSGAPDGTNTAYLNRETGEIFFDSEFDEVDELPDDLDDDQKYVTIPHRDDFDLGLSLVRSFVAQCAQDKREDLLGCFQSKGAYSRFKRLLEEFGLLESWYAFENEAVTLALKGWCAEHGIVVG